MQKLSWLIQSCLKTHSYFWAMKQVVVLLLSAVMCMNMFSCLFTLFSFKINQEYISFTLCEKREVKNNRCHGSCYLKKQLKEEEQKENMPQKNLKTDFDFNFFFQAVSRKLFSDILIKVIIITEFASRLCKGWLSELIKPPGF